MARPPSTTFLCSKCGSVTQLHLKTLLTTPMGIVAVPVHTCLNASCASQPQACVGDAHCACNPPPTDVSGAGIPAGAWNVEM